MKILVTGASGLLGKKVFHFLQSYYEVVGTRFTHKSPGLAKLDLSDLNNISTFLDGVKPDLVIHTAAFVDVKLSEQYAPLAKRINADSTLEIGRWCEKHGARLIYISTDYVFDGESGPYYENSEPYPIQIYGYTKLLGEMLLHYHPCGAVVRVAILHGVNDAFDKQTVTTNVIRSLKAQEQLVLDHGRVKYPTLIDDVAKGLLQIIVDDSCGVFHIAGQEPVTRFEWAMRVAKVFHLKESLLVPDVNLEKDTIPRRPRDVKLINTRLHFEPHGFDESLEIIKKQMEEESLI
jgi:dTDP-4-dehydrorhamnose reductase